MITVIILMMNMVFAQDCSDVKSSKQVEKQEVITTDVPSHLKDAVIIVRTKDGRESQVSANQFKVVPRKQQYIVKETKEHTERVCKVSSKDKNMVMLGGRRDHTNLSSSVVGNVGTVSSERGPVFDLGYMRKDLVKTKLGDIGVGGSIDSNGTPRIFTGIEF